MTTNGLYITQTRHRLAERHEEPSKTKNIKSQPSIEPGVTKNSLYDRAITWLTPNGNATFTNIAKIAFVFAIGIAGVVATILGITAIIGSAVTLQPEGILIGLGITAGGLCLLKVVRDIDKKSDEEAFLLKDDPIEEPKRQEPKKERIVYPDSTIIKGNPTHSYVENLTHNNKVILCDYEAPRPETIGEDEENESQDISNPPPSTNPYINHPELDEARQTRLQIHKRNIEVEQRSQVKELEDQGEGQQNKPKIQTQAERIREQMVIDGFYDPTKHPTST